MRIRTVQMATLVTAVFLATALASSGQWLHVSVEKGGEAAEQVRVNLPLSLVESVLPLIQNEEFRGGKLRMQTGEFKIEDLRRIWEAIKDQPVADFVTVQSGDSNVRVSKTRDELIVQVEEKSAKSVDIRMPLQVVDALLSGSEDELNLLEAVRALKDSGIKDIVSIRDGESTVRVWIDSAN